MKKGKETSQPIDFQTCSLYLQPPKPYFENCVHSSVLIMGIMQP